MFTRFFGAHTKHFVIYFSRRRSLPTSGVHALRTFSASRRSNEALPGRGTGLPGGSLRGAPGTGATAPGATLFRSRRSASRRVSSSGRVSCSPVFIYMYVCMHVHTKHFVHFLEEEVQPSYLRAGALSRSARSVAPPTLLFRGPGVTHSPDPSSVCHSGFSFFGGISSSERFPQTERSIQSFHHGTGGAEPAAGRDRQAYTGQGKVWPRTENRDACGLPTHGSRSARPGARTARPLIGRVRNPPPPLALQGGVAAGRRP